MRQRMLGIGIWVLVGLMSTVSMGANRVWFVRPVEVAGGAFQYEHNALALRGGVWPTVGYSENSSSGTALMGVTGWQSGMASGNMGAVSSAVADNGRMAFAYANGQVTFLDNNGWSSSSYGGEVSDAENRAAVDFSSTALAGVAHNGGSELTLARYNGMSWYQDVVMNDDLGVGAVNTSVFAFQYDSMDQAQVAYAAGTNLKIAMKGVSTGYTWQFNTISSGVSIEKLDMAVDSSDKTWVAYKVDGQTGLSIASYDPITYSWTQMLLDGSYDAGGYFDLVADGLGGVGIAYTNSDDELIYRYNNASGIWSDEAVLNFESSEAVSSSSSCDVALAYDLDNNPVIAFGNDDDNSNMYLAYDPILVPEPMSVLGLLSGLVMLRKRLQ